MLVKLVLGIEAHAAKSTGVVVRLWKVHGLQVVDHVVPPHKVLGTDDADVGPTSVAQRRRTNVLLQIAPSSLA